jgi:hypothetical protein
MKAVARAVTGPEGGGRGCEGGKEAGRGHGMARIYCQESAFPMKAVEKRQLGEFVAGGELRQGYARPRKGCWIGWAEFTERDARWHGLANYGSLLSPLARTWQSDVGLPDNSVVGIDQTPDGFLWVAAKTGLVRFDGVQFRQFPLTVAGGGRGDPRPVSRPARPALGRDGRAGRGLPGPGTAGDGIPFENEPAGPGNGHDGGGRRRCRMGVLCQW